MIDLSDELKDLIKEEGNDVLIIRQNKKIQCRCYDHLTQSTDKTCKYCLGTGYVTKVEKHRSLCVVSAVPETLSRMIRSISPANVAVESRHFYFTSNVNIDRGDLVVDVSFDKLGRPLSDMNFFLVHFVDKKRTGGKIQYLKASVSLDPVETSIRAFNLRKYHSITNYDPIG